MIWSLALDIACFHFTGSAAISRACSLKPCNYDDDNSNDDVDGSVNSTNNRHVTFIIIIDIHHHGYA